VSLRVEAGEFVAVVGPSGSGKSTLLLALAGLVHPDTGEVYLEGQGLCGLNPTERARIRRRTIGFLFQTFHLIPYLTALENVQVPLYLAGAPLSRQAEVATRLLDQVGLADRLDHKPSELSVGEQQRVALARALISEPRLILADEPTGSLDPERGEEMVAHLEHACQQGMTIVMVTHDPDIAARAQRRIALQDGRVVSPACEAS
jgi:putative ABC transport system ATP-binding protein